MELSSKMKIRRKPSHVQLATCNAVETLENEHGQPVTAEDLLSTLSASTRLKTLENRLHEYTRRGWLRAHVSRKRGKATVYGVTDAWFDLLDAVDDGNVRVTARDTDRLGTCEGHGCNTHARLILYRGRRLCKACLNPDDNYQAGDATHLLVKSNWETII